MQLGWRAAIAAVLALSVPAAEAQSLSPMHLSGTTPSLIKGFRLVVGNPYRQRMGFVVVGMEPGFVVAAAGIYINAPEIWLAPGASRPVIVQFRIDPARKERTIGICVYPKDLDGPVLPRVCGTYTGRLIGAGG